MQNPAQQRTLHDSAFTHTILQDQLFFEFQRKNEPWQSCEIITIAWKQNFKFLEGRATIVLPGATPLSVNELCMPRTPLIAWRAIETYEQTISTPNEEALELRQGSRILATAQAVANGLYEMNITAVSLTQLWSEEGVGERSRGSWPRASNHNQS